MLPGLDCDVRDQPVDAWPDTPECDLTPYKECTTSNDCLTVTYPSNCCGSTRVAAVATESWGQALLLIDYCAPWFLPTCTCEAMTVAEDGLVLVFDAVKDCVNGRCQSRVPPER